MHLSIPEAACGVVGTGGNGGGGGFAFQTWHEVETYTRDTL